MKREALMRTDRSWIWALSSIWFLALEIVFKIKLGVIFWMSFGWFMVLDWEAIKFFGHGFSRNLPDRFLKSFLYGFLLVLFIFVLFSSFNILLRRFNNDLRFFQLP